MTFGERLKAARIESGLKQAELAKMLNTTGNTISNWENNVSKPDLDMLSYICGILHVTASYFLQAQLPEDEVSIPELNIIKKYRALDAHGKEMVDFTLEKEYERATSKVHYYNFEESSHYGVSMVAEPRGSYKVNAAHSRTDMELPEDADTTENDIMDDDKNWE